jgi:hypothetical protein
VVKCSYVLEECTASTYRVNELVQADVEVIQRKKCVNYNRGSMEGEMGYRIASSQWQL